MLPKCLLVAVFFYISTRQCTAEEIGFTSQLQLGSSSTQCPFDAQDQAAAHSESEPFTSSPSYPLPPTSGKLKSRPTTVYRPRSLEALHRARLRSSSKQHALEGEEPAVIWDPVEIEGPDVEDLHTLGQLARMSGNAYALPGQSNWYDVDQAWNMVCFNFYIQVHAFDCVLESFPFGWEESDGFRGHVFLSSDNYTVVLAIKGTTLQGPTSKLDKFNDNL